jgi:peptide/nickel transport system permease protein
MAVVAPELASADAPVTAVPGRRFRRPSAKIIVGVAIVGFFVLMAIIGPLVAPYNPSAIGPDILAPPSAAHLLGTTQTGQDVLSEMLHGAGPTLEVGFLAAALATALSILVGVSAGFLGGIADEALSMLANIFLVIPALPLLVVLAAFLHSPSNTVIAFVIAVTGWAWGARVLRAQTLALRRNDYVQSARAAGEYAWRIILWEILPNEAAIAAACFLFTVLFAIVTDASLTFLGVGQITSWTWGSILYWAENNAAFASGAWWWYVPPGLCIALLGTGLALMNYGMDELINPRLRAAGFSRRSIRRVSKSNGLTLVLRPSSTQPTGTDRGDTLTPVRGRSTGGPQ